MALIKQIPNLGGIEFKDAFVDRYRSLLGSDFDLFIETSLRFLRRSMRVNTLKVTVPLVKARLEKNWRLDPIPWCKEGFWIEGERRDVGNLIEHCLGYIYIQEAASMIPPIVLDPKPGEMILDMCAAPGSKTTQIAQMMNNQGILIANDYKGLRLAPLGLNIQRMGITNAVTTLMQGRHFSNLVFDRILVDAPCSGTGTVRKSFKILREWNPNVIKRLAGMQKQLLQTAIDNCKKGGVIVYSTCSLEPEENEGVISAIVRGNPQITIEPIELALKKGMPIMEFEGESYHSDVAKCLRIWPHDNDTEGFFVAKLRKL